MLKANREFSRKIPWSSEHVGIYLGNRDTSNSVVILSYIKRYADFKTNLTISVLFKKMTTVTPIT